jgi:hypothetical protein
MTLSLPKKSNGNTYVFDYKQQSKKNAPATFAATEKSLADTLGALSRAGLHRVTEAARSNAPRSCNSAAGARAQLGASSKWANGAMRAPSINWTAPC